MCGVAGYVSAGNGRDAAERMAAALRHRGPDAKGQWVSPDGHVQLAHTRLAILDLSATGAQPMRDDATGNVIVFNGEIYNHPDLRKELEALGVAFCGHSDTETLLRGYGVWGASLFARLRGMFAFAIYNARSREIILCRDRLGIKPLYTGRAKSGSLVFASEARALLPQVGSSFTPAGVAAYLQRGSCPHEEMLFAGIKEFPSGCWAAVRIGNDEIHPVRYWPTGTAEDFDFAEASGDPVHELRQLLEDAVSSHLMADVPIACFLSGGTPVRF